MNTMPDHLHLHLETRWFNVEACLAMDVADPDDPTHEHHHDTFRVYLGRGTPGATSLYLRCNLPPFIALEIDSGAKFGATAAQVAKAVRGGYVELDHPVATSLARRAVAWAVRRGKPTQPTDWFGIGA